MNLRALKAVFYAAVQDKNKPHLWKRKEVLGDRHDEPGENPGYINEAYIQAVYRARLILDTTTATATFQGTLYPVCSIPVLAGQAVYHIHPAVIAIKRARLASDATDLERTTESDRDSHASRWRTATGKPRHFISDDESGAIRLYRIPVAADTLRLEVYRRPLRLLINDEDEPEIHSDYHLPMLQYAYYLAYSRPDMDTYMPEKAMECLALFEAAFGTRQSAKSAQVIGKHSPPVVRYSW